MTTAKGDTITDATISFSAEALLSSDSKEEFAVCARNQSHYGAAVLLRGAALHLRRRSAPVLTIAILLGMIMCCQAASAQSGAGSIQGSVTDSTGAVVTGASIHVVNRSTNVSSDTTSNQSGFYQVPELFTGSYTVTISADGFKSYQKSLDLLVAQNAVIDATLSPGPVTQQISVSGDTVQLTTTDNPALQATLENARINQLPMNGRILSTLLGMTTPGLDNGVDSSGNATQAANVNGMRREGLDVVIDGVTTQIENNGGLSYPRQQLEDPDAVQEVTLLTTEAGAQYGAPATAIVTTKSGTNNLHGSFFETARNNGIGVAKARQDAYNLSVPPLVRNEFGGSAGGPIVLPHLYHGKDKSFWFFAYERYSQASGVSKLAAVPTLAMRQGDFSGLVNGSGVLQTIYDPSTTANSAKCPATGAANAYCRTPFPNNQIPAGEESPLAKVYNALLPVPTSAANPLVTNNLNQEIHNIVIEPQETFRLDHEFNEKNRAFLRYTQNLANTNLSGGPRNLAADGIAAGAAVGAQGSGGYAVAPSALFLSSIGYTHVFSPSFFAETTISQQWQTEAAVAGVDNQQDYESMLGLPNNFGEPGFPLFSGLIFNLGTSQTGNNKNVQILSTIDENLTKTTGKHQFQFGGRYRHGRYYQEVNALNDTFTIDNLPTALYNTASGANYTAIANTGYPEPSLFLGSGGVFTVNITPPGMHYHRNEIDDYFQDNYHFSKNLTINLGLRHEAHTGIWTKYNMLSSFDFKNDAEVLKAPPATLIAEGLTTQAIITNDQNIGVKFETPSEAGMPPNLLRNYFAYFLPRVGVAYQLFGGRYGTVLRGGYGRYVSGANEGQDAFNPSLKSTPVVGTYSQNYTAAAQAIDGLPNELLRYNDPAVFGVMGSNTANVVNTNAINSILPGINLTTVSPNYPNAISTETSLTVEQSLKGNSALRVSWLWVHGTNLPLSYYYNYHPSNYQWEMATGAVPPTGGASVIGTPQQNTYASTATGPYDQTTWGSGSFQLFRSAWSNDNALQAVYQRLFHRGVAYEISYVYSHALTVGSFTSSAPPAIYNYSDFPGGMGETQGQMTSPYGTVYPGVAPPPPPTGTANWQSYHDFIKFADYGLDSSVPMHHIKFNGLVDLPFGRGKRFFSNVNGLVNELLGGFQIAGDGNILTQVFRPTTSAWWGPTAPIKVYKHKAPITDCRSGVCLKEYMWYNGYLAPTATTGVAGSTCTTNCVSGLPADYVPFQTWVDNTPGTSNYLTNNVQVTLANGSKTTIAYDAGPQASDYLAKSWLNGPTNWVADASIFKVFPIREQINLRFVMDAFNVFNVQGYTNPGTNGIETYLPNGNSSSYNAPRQIQLTLRLNF